MKTLFSVAMCLAILSGCTKGHEDSGNLQHKSSELLSIEMRQFAETNSAVVLNADMIDWHTLTSDVQDAFTQRGKPVLVELILPDVNRDTTGNLVLVGSPVLLAPMTIRIQALITTNMLPEVRASRSNLTGLWVVMKVETVGRRPIENDDTEIVLGGKATVIESRPPNEWIDRLASPGTKK